MISGPISLRVSVTEACPLRCRYCFDPSEAHSSRNDGRLEARELIILLGALHQVSGIDKLRFTGGEPLLRRDLPALVAGATGLGIADVSLTTNGQRLAALAAPLHRSGLHRVNISLDSLDPRTYASITRRGGLTACLNGVQAALAAHLQPVKLNMVVMRGINDHEVIDLLEFGLARGCHIRFLELMPVGVAARDFNRRFVACDEVHARLSERFRLDPIAYERGATSRDYRVEDRRRGRWTLCGFISPTSRPFCDGCNRLRLTHDGRLMGCLARRDSLDLRPVLCAARAGDTQPLLEAVAAALAIKQEPRSLADQRHMNRIGG